MAVVMTDGRLPLDGICVGFDDRTDQFIGFQANQIAAAQLVWPRVLSPDFSRGVRRVRS